METMHSVETILKTIEDSEKRLIEVNDRINLKKLENERLLNAIENINFDNLTLSRIYGQISNNYLEINSYGHELEFYRKYIQNLEMKLPDALTEEQIEKEKENKNLKMELDSDEGLVHLKNEYNGTLVNTNEVNFTNKNKVIVAIVKYDRETKTYNYYEAKKGGDYKLLKVKKLNTVKKYIERIL